MANTHPSYLIDAISRYLDKNFIVNPLAHPKSFHSVAIEILDLITKAQIDAIAADKEAAIRAKAEEEIRQLRQGAKP